VTGFSEIICAGCEKIELRRNGDINRAKKLGSPIYCGKECAGRRRRVEKTAEQKKEEKRLYDKKRREENAERIKAEKAAYFKRTYDPEKAAIKRKENMPKHVEYCQRPEYKAWKQQYDKQYLARKQFGEFWEAALALRSIEQEISERISETDLAVQKGTLNKSQTRKREYERLNRN